MKNTSGWPFRSASASARSIVRTTSASGFARRRQRNFVRTFIDGVPYEVPTSTPGNRVPISTTSSHVAIERHASAIYRRPMNDFEALQQAVPLEGRTVADIGCGDGAIVRALRDAGADAIGIDVDVAPARENDP